MLNHIVSMTDLHVFACNIMFMNLETLHFEKAKLKVLRARFDSSENFDRFQRICMSFFNSDR